MRRRTLLSLALPAVALAAWMRYRAVVSRPPDEAALEHAAGLDQRVNLTLRGAGLLEAMRQLGEAGGTHILPDTGSRASILGSSNLTVTGSFKDLPLRTAMREVIDQADPHLEYEVHGHTIVFGPGQAVIREYDASDIMARWRASGAKMPDVLTLQSTPPRDPTPTSDDLTNLIVSFVNPENWYNTGAAVGMATTFGDHLFIAHTARVQRQVDALLAAIRLANRAGSVNDVEPCDPPPPDSRAESLIDLDLPNSSLGVALDTVARLSRTSIAVHWAEMPDGLYAAASNMPVRIRLRHAMTLQAVRAILATQDARDADTYCFSRSGMVVAGGSRSLDEPLPIRIYNVRDLVAQQMAVGKSAGDAVDALGTAIMETVLPGAWRDAGGSRGQIRSLNDLLIVQHNPEGHRLVAEFLAELRAATESPPATAGTP